MVTSCVPEPKEQVYNKILSYNFLSISLFSKKINYKV